MHLPFYEYRERTSWFGLVKMANEMRTMKAEDFWNRSGQHFATVGALMALVMLMFGDLLLSSDSTVVGNQWHDMSFQFLSWRSFGFQELARGNIALWNPHIYSGAPYFGGFQAALLYPPNLLFLILPLPKAINWCIALHVFMMGLFTYGWVLARGVSAPGAFFAGVIAMFGGTYFIHIYAGHLPNLCAMVWMPAILFSIDRVFDVCAVQKDSRPGKTRWILLGMLVIALQVLSGHPQYVFITAIAVGAYSLIRLSTAANRGAVLAALIAMCIGGLLLSAVQWVTGLAATAETIRSKALPYDFAAGYAFPPESLITLIAPNFFGDMSAQHPYWGRFNLWEMSLYIGGAGFLCASYAAIYVERRLALAPLMVIILMIILALGVHTPLYALLYNYVPGFSKFRGMSKFIFPASMFLCLLAAYGFDNLTSNLSRKTKFGHGVLVFAGCLIFVAALIGMTDGSALIQAVRQTGETFNSVELIRSPDFLSSAKMAAIAALLTVAITVGVLVVLVNMSEASRRRKGLLLAVAVIEMFTVARGYRDTLDAEPQQAGPVARFLAEHPGDFRILDTMNPNGAMGIGADDIWGSDPSITRRYAEFIAYTQGSDPDKVTQIMAFHHLDPLFKMLRLRYAFASSDGVPVVVETPNPLNRLQLISHFKVASARDQVFAAMREPGFDPADEVILEKTPDPVPEGVRPHGYARITASSTDWMEIEANVSGPAILVITDAYTPSWRATAMVGSVQNRYELQPANYVLRAIPLTGGVHRIRMEYTPPFFLASAWVSGLAWLLFLLVTTIAALRRGMPWRKSAISTSNGHV